MAQSVMIADDDPITIKVLSAILNSDDDYNVVATVENGMDAITVSGEHKPDIICLDINMPGMTGMAAIPEIRIASPETRIIMISGCATMNLVNSSLEAGAEDFIIKPFDFEKVMAILKK
jgi:YesN/AraC family two-component response regulator